MSWARLPACMGGKNANMFPVWKTELKRPHSNVKRKGKIILN